MTIFTIIVSIVAAFAMPISLYRAEKRMAELSADRNADLADLVAEPRILVSMLAAFAIGAFHGLNLLVSQDIVKQILAWILVALDIAVFAYICWLWYQHHENKDEGRQLVPLLVVTAFMTALSFCAVWRACETCGIGQPFEALFYMLVTMLPIFTVGWLIAQLYYNRAYFEQDVDKAERYEKSGKTAWWVTIIALILVLVLVLCTSVIPAIAKGIGNLVNPTSSSPAQQNAGTKASTSGSRQYPYFLNRELQSDNDKNNDYYFGYKPDTSKDKDYQVQDFMSRLDYDPMFVSAQAVTLATVTDSPLLDRILYYGYEEKNNVLEKADAATMILKDDKDIFEDASSTIKAFYRDRVTKVEWKKVSNLTNQIYADPYVIGQVPSLILAESEVEEDWCLIFTFSYGKDETSTVAFRAACGWQWVNCADELGMEPQPTPVSSNSGGGGNNPSPSPSPSPTTSPSPGPSPTEPTRYNKDKSQGTSDSGNVESGLDEDTNNGDGAQYSTKDRDNNSDHGSYDDYRNSDNQNDSANSGSGGSSNAGGNVDQNDDGGYSDTAPADRANDHDNPAGVYGGPPD